MVTNARKGNKKESARHYGLAGMLLLFSVAALFACSSSSDTRTQAKAAQSGTYQVVATITAPPDGATIVLEQDGTTDVTVSVSAQGGSGTYGYTWQLQGPTVSSTATGQAPAISLFETGTHTFTATVIDSGGLRAVDRITVNVVDQQRVAFFQSYITAPSTTTLKKNTTYTFQVNELGGSGTIASRFWTTSGPGFSQPDNSTAQAPTFLFTETGTYTVTVKSTDTQGHTATATKTYTVVES